MSGLFGVDLDRRRAERAYRTFVPEDDDFHDEEMTDRWWETETSWFSWNVPERRLGGWTYCQARPNANLCNGGAWVWDDTGAYPWELAYRAEYSGLQLPPRADANLRDFAWPNGVHVRVLEPLRRYAVTYADPGGLELDLRVRGHHGAQHRPYGRGPVRQGGALRPGGPRHRGPWSCGARRSRSTATRCVTARGGRDPRDARAPTPTPDPDGTRGGPSPAGAFGGVGYSFGVAGPGEAWLAYAIPGPEVEPVVCGFLLRGRCVRAHRGRGATPDLRRLGRGGRSPSRSRRWTTGDRRLSVRGEAVSRHWRGHGGDSLVHWHWDDGVEGWGEDQSYFSRDQWEANRRRASQG